MCVRYICCESAHNVSDYDESLMVGRGRPIRLIPGVSCPPAPQDLRQLHAPTGGGGHDDHGQQARLQMCLHLRPVPGQPSAPI